MLRSFLYIIYSKRFMHNLNFLYKNSFHLLTTQRYRFRFKTRMLFYFSFKRMKNTCSLIFCSIHFITQPRFYSEIFQNYDKFISLILLNHLSHYLLVIAIMFLVSPILMIPPFLLPLPRKAANGEELMSDGSDVAATNSHDGRLAALERKVQEQADELTCMKSAMADCLLRLQTIETHKRK